MAKKTALKTAGISMAGFQPRARAFDGQTPAATEAAAPGPAGDAPASDTAGAASASDPADGATAAPGTAGARPPRPATKPFTGVGSVMAALTREADLTQELAGTRAALGAAQQQLAQWQTAELVQTLDARSVRRSQWANRSEAEFATPEFAALRHEIAGANGNVQPIKVRRIAGAFPAFDGQTPVYEIVYGHRRHRACLDLGLPVRAVVASDMDDRTLFEAMDRENRGRKNLSAWEQGRMYDEALRQGLYPSLRRLADSLGVNLSDASRAVQLAKLPPEMVGAFASPLDLQVRWAKPLADALQRDPDGGAAARATAGGQPAGAWRRRGAGRPHRRPALGRPGTAGWTGSCGRSGRSGHYGHRRGQPSAGRAAQRCPGWAGDRIHARRRCAGAARTAGQAAEGLSRRQPGRLTAEAPKRNQAA